MVSHRRAIAILRGTGISGRDVAVLNNYGVLLLITGKYDEAEETFMESIRIRGNRELSKMEYARLNLPELRHYQGRNEQALRDITQVLDLWDGEGRAPARLYQAHGDILSALGLHDKAAKAYDTCQAVIHRNLGGNEKQLGEVAVGIGRNLARAGKWEDALEELENGRKLLVKAVARRGHPRLAICLRELASVLAHFGRMDEALDTADEACKMCHTIFGEEHQETLSAQQVTQQIEAAANAMMNSN